MAQLPERVRALEVRIDDLDGEQQRTRRRLHELESDRATIRLLSGQVKSVLESTERVAQSAAEKAVGLALETRSRARRETWGYRLKWISAGASATGIVAGVLTVFH